MKILNIYFKNINSLEGENRIDFEQAPFNDTGVFAITGPNGSGKSSILDAITLALYGETFRFDKPAQHIITQHTDESFSHIEFALGVDKYRSSWQVRRTKDNPHEVHPSEMQLLRLNNGDETLATSPQQVCARIAEITGMNFRSFTRSILLAQGDFSAFLNALDSERMDILEKIISTDIYADHKKNAIDKLTEAQKQLAFLEQDLAAVPLIEPESLEACEHDLADFSEQTAEYQEEINRLKQHQTTLAETSTIKSQIDTLETQLENAITERLSVQKKLDQLAAAENALALRADIDVIKPQKHLLGQESAALDALQNELKQIQATLAMSGFDSNSIPKLADLKNTPESFTEQKQAIDNIRNQVGLINASWQSEIILLKSLATQIAEKQASLAEVTAWLDGHIIDQPLLENFPDLDGLKNLRLLRQEFDEKQKSLNKWSKSTSSALQKNKDAIDGKNKKLAKLNQELATEEKKLEALAQGNSFEQIEDLLVEQKDRVKAVEELVGLANANEKLAPQSGFFFGLFGKKVQPDRNVVELEQELEILKQQLKREENIRLSLEKAISNDALIARMTHDREHLIDGKPCPLCGSAEHPYGKYPPAPANSQQALLDQRIKLKRLTAEIAQAEQNVIWAKKRDDRNQASNTQLQQIKSRWHTLCNQLNITSSELVIEKTSAIKQLLTTESTELKNIGLLLAQYKATDKNIYKIKGLLEKNTAIVNQLQIAVQHIDAEWQTEPHRLAENEGGAAKVQQEEQELIAKLTDQLAQLGETLPAQGKEGVLIDRLKLRFDDYQGYDSRRKSLSEEIEVLLTKQASGEVQIVSYKQRLDEFNKQLNTEEIVGLHLALVEKQKLIADKESQVNRLKAESEDLDKVVADKIAGTQFSSLEEIEQALILLLSQPDVTQQMAKLDTNVSNMGSELNKLHEQLDKAVHESKLTLTLEEIELQLKAVAEKMTIAKMEAQRLETIVREQKQYKERYSTLLAQLESQQLSVQKANAEVAELSVENGMALRRRIQEQMVERLLSQTNASLEKISGRYYLRHKPSDRGLALEIEDTYQGNVRRLPKTLSGGESFIVSLALALGLSEMANNGRSVDSLFLDEGFGNLDAETLYTVVNTLEGLRAHGKTVGVISHVEAVQKRFKAQLQLVKKPNGLGELRKVS